MRTTRWTTALAAAIAIAACGGGSGPAGNSGGPDIRGTYEGQHRLALTPEGEGTTVAGCPGRIVVSSSSGGTFSGNMIVDACIAFGVSERLVVPLTGTVQEDGSVRFTVALLVDALVQVLEQQGCEASPEDAYTGMVVGSEFDAAIEADVTCVDNPDIHVELSFEGTRGS